MLVTTRGKWLLTVAIGATLWGVVEHNLMVAQLSFAILLWVGVEWLLFRRRFDAMTHHSSAERVILDRGKPLATLWCSRVVRVQTRVRTAPGFARLYIEVAEQPHAALEFVSGQSSRRQRLGGETDIVLDYSVRPQTVGVVQLEGIRLRLSDLQAFFHAETLVPLRQQFRILPPVLDSGTWITLQKRHNQLPPPGTHRFQRPGMGSELMEIRDYVPGDPPRSIAWKISARRDTLMSKQFESEVPVQCTLLIDVSPSVRLGFPSPTSLNTLIRLAATMIEACVAKRDPIGLSLFSENSISVTLPSSNRQTPLKLLKLLCDAHSRPLEPVSCASYQFRDQALNLARTLYPSEFSIADKSRWFMVLPLRPRKRRQLRQQTRLAIILANHFRLGVTGISDLIHDDLEMSFYAQRFLAEHQVPYAGPLYDARGTYLFANESKISQLAKLLLHKTAHGKDNELFVILVDLFELEDYLQPLLKAINVAVARHHRVVVISTWLNDIPPPGESVNQLPEDLAKRSLEEVIMAADRARQQRSYHSLRRSLAKYRVPLIRATDATASRFVLEQLEAVRLSRIST